MRTDSKLDLKQNGFTLVELMVVVAIIGLLSAVAIPNFQKYQARTKTAEAKLHLSSIYTAEQSFYATYNIYLTCLRYMGYDPQEEAFSRYYSTGFRESATVDPAAYSSALNSGLTSSECPITIVGDTMSSFNAGKRVAAAPSDRNHFTSGVTTIGTQADDSSQTFTAGAAGVVHKKFTSTTQSSFMTIDQAKVIRIIRNGF
jgi:type IV pilus assembly protein PilA